MNLFFTLSLAFLTGQIAPEEVDVGAGVPTFFDLDVEQVFTFENSASRKALENLGTEYPFNQQKWENFEKDSFFAQWLTRFWMYEREEAQYHPKVFQIQPLLWCLSVLDHQCVHSQYLPNAYSRCVLKIRNTQTGTSWLMTFCLYCRSERPLEPQPRAYLTVMRAEMGVEITEWEQDGTTEWEEEDDGWSKTTPEPGPEITGRPWRLDENRNFEEQLLEYLRAVDFGPNLWDERVKCVYLKIRCSREEIKRFRYPLISEEEKADLTYELECRLIDMNHDDG